MEDKKIVIIGGGLAGLTAAIHLSRSGRKVTLVEKQDYPKHKVCGEYVSNEILPYLQWLGADPMELGPAIISKAIFSTVDGKSIRCDLPLGGFGVSRYALDLFLYKHALSSGCQIVKQSVTDCVFSNEHFELTLGDDATIYADIVIGAFGKRSNIDQKMSRGFIQKKSPWLAVKAHYRGDFPDDVVGLHNFEGGYCGVSKVENDSINICYLADFESFKKYKNIEEYQREIVFKNSHLKEIFENSKPLFEQPLTISQISFEKKLPVENHILMIGDTAGLIHPLCGNGMAMAMHSAKIACECLEDFLNGKTTTREELERMYTTAWKRLFSARLATGRLLAAALQKNTVSGLLFHMLHYFPFLLPKIIKMTHGKPLKIAA
jgi:flavin-dependent dehydrogenase